MAKSKKPRKARNPHKLRLRQARQCQLYRWSSTEGPASDFNSHGPYHPDKVVKLMEWALSSPQTWQITALACFQSEEGDYYEEMVTFPPIGPLVLNKQPETLYEYQRLGIEEAKKSGNHKHFIDAVVSLSLYTPELAHKLEQDNWLKKQTLLRYQAIKKSLEKQL